MTVRETKIERLTNSGDIPVEFYGRAETRMLADPTFANWLKQLDEKYKVVKIEVEQTYFIPSGKLLFAAMVVEITPETKIFPRNVVHWRPNSSSMIVVIKDVDTSLLWTIIARQSRLAAIDLALPEAPAGIVDDEDDSLIFSATALREYAEETTIKVPRTAIFSLEGFYPSPGALSEFIALNAALYQMSGKKLFALRTTITGLKTEGEEITLDVIPFSSITDVCKNDPKALLGYHQVMEMRRRGDL